MSIPQAVPSLVPQLIFAISSWDALIAVTSCAEATFYATLEGGVKNSGKLVKWIRETSIGHIRAIQNVFNTINFITILFSTYTLLSEIQAKFPITWINLAITTVSAQSVAVVLALGVATAVGIVLVNRFSPVLASQNEKNEVSISENLSPGQKVAKGLHVTKMVLGVALACFSKNKFSLALTLAATGYSLLKNVNLKWISLSCIFKHNPQFLMSESKVTYNMLVLPSSALSAQDDCAICLDKQGDMAFCANHVFHKTCLTELALEKTDSFIYRNNYRRIDTRHYRDGFYTHTSYHYHIALSKDNFPSCPECREVPLQNDCDIIVTDRVHGKINASVTIVRPPVDRQHIFENIYAVYNVVQASVAYLQTYPELAATIIKVQQVMVGIDFIGYAFTTYYLCNKVNARFNPENSTIIKIAICAGLIAMAALSYLVVLQINAYLRPVLVLKEYLEKLGISPEILKTMDISWNSPVYMKLMQALYINRIVSTVALSFFSEQRKTNLLSAAAQIASLIGISRLPWIQLTQTLELPLASILATGGKVKGLIAKDLKSLQVSFHFLVNNSCAENATHLQSTLKSIYSFTSSFFDKSSWERFWQVRYQNGVEVGRSIFYRITLQRNSSDFSGSGLSPTLFDYSIKVFDAVYGAAGVVI